MQFDLDGVDDADEENQSAYIPYSDDEDNQGGVPDYDDDVGDAREDDLVGITIGCEPNDLGGYLELRTGTAIKVWSDEHKGAGNLLIPYNGESYRRWPVSEFPAAMWVEGKETASFLSGENGLRLYYTPSNDFPWYPGGQYNPDLVSVTIVQVDMDMAGVADSAEETVGGYVLLGGTTGIDLDPVSPLWDGVTMPQAGAPFDSSHPMTLDVNYASRGSGTIEIWDYNNPAAPTEVNLPATYDSAGQLPSDLRIKGATASSAVGYITLIWEYSIQGRTVQDRIKCTVVEVDLDIAGVDDADEEDPGGYVTYNKDDDNDEGTADWEEEGTVTDEDNLVKISLSLAPAFGHYEGKVKLEMPYGQDEIRVWEDVDKGTRVLPTAAGNNYVEWYPDDFPSELYVEGYSYVGGTCDLTLIYSDYYLGKEAQNNNLPILTYSSHRLGSIW